MGLPTSLTFAVLSSTASLQAEQIGNVVLKARFERRGIRRPFGINHQIAQETDAQNGSGGGMCYRHPKPSTERDACMYRIPAPRRPRNEKSHTSAKEPRLEVAELTRRSERDNPALLSIRLSFVWTFQAVLFCSV